jgi:hypothetical protein
MTEKIIPSDNDLALWWSNLEQETRGAINFDFKDQYESDFLSTGFDVSLHWLQENHEHHYDALIEFVEKDHASVVRFYREKAALMTQRDELEFSEEPLVRIPTEADREFVKGAMVQAWVFVPSTLEVTVDVWQDDSPECPNDWGSWRLYSFNSRHNSFKHPDEFKMGSAEFKKAEESGLIFRLGYYEHGQCSWFLQGEGGAGTDCQFDGVRFAGLLVWKDTENAPWDGHCKTDPKTGEPILVNGKKQKIDNTGRYECAKKTAKAFCEGYTAWANGDVYGYSINEAPGVDGSSCGGFYSFEEMIGEVVGMLPAVDRINWEGDLADLAAEAEQSIKRKNGQQ